MNRDNLTLDDLKKSFNLHKIEPWQVIRFAIVEKYIEEAYQLGRKEVMKYVEKKN